jgi:LmbE family N-acetylglucosaminyl deacetylase
LANGRADALLVFDEVCIPVIPVIPDNRSATEAPLLVAGRHHLSCLAWVVPERVAAQLDGELGTSFVGRRDTDVDIVVEVDRDRQRAAIACHASQAGENPVLWRRLELTGDREHLRWLAQG